MINRKPLSLSRVLATTLLILLSFNGEGIAQESPTNSNSPGERAKLSKQESAKVIQRLNKASKSKLTAQEKANEQDKTNLGLLKNLYYSGVDISAVDIEALVIAEQIDVFECIRFLDKARPGLCLDLSKSLLITRSHAPRRVLIPRILRHSASDKAKRDQNYKWTLRKLLEFDDIEAIHIFITYFPASVIDELRSTVLPTIKNEPEEIHLTCKICIAARLAQSINNRSKQDREWLQKHSEKFTVKAMRDCSRISDEQNVLFGPLWCTSFFRLALKNRVLAWQSIPNFSHHSYLKQTAPFRSAFWLFQIKWPNFEADKTKAASWLTVDNCEEILAPLEDFERAEFLNWLSKDKAASLVLSQHCIRTLRLARDQSSNFANTTTYLDVLKVINANINCFNKDDATAIRQLLPTPSQLRRLRKSNDPLGFLKAVDEVKVKLERLSK